MGRLGYGKILINCLGKANLAVIKKALELLCRLLFTEGSNPSLSVPSPNSPMLLTTMYQLKKQ